VGDTGLEKPQKTSQIDKSARERCKIGRTQNIDPQEPGDAGLAEVVDAWPRLTPAEREKVLAVVRRDAVKD
jgi:hypothetical protein